jgi:hypothetical protein
MRRSWADPDQPGRWILRHVTAPGGSLRRQSNQFGARRSSLRLASTLRRSTATRNARRAFIAGHPRFNFRDVRRSFLWRWRVHRPDRVGKIARGASLGAASDRSDRDRAQSKRQAQETAQAEYSSHSVRPRIVRDDESRRDHQRRGKIRSAVNHFECGSLDFNTCQVRLQEKKRSLEGKSTKFVLN